MDAHPAGKGRPLDIRVLRHRPLAIEAVRVTEDNRREVALWCNGVIINYGVGIYTDTNDFAHAAVGDWIIKGPFGDFYPAPERVIFAKFEGVVPLVSE